MQGAVVRGFMLVGISMQILHFVLKNKSTDVWQSINQLDQCLSQWVPRLANLKRTQKSVTLRPNFGDKAHYLRNAMASRALQFSIFGPTLWLSLKLVKIRRNWEDIKGNATEEQEERLQSTFAESLELKSKKLKQVPPSLAVVSFPQKSTVFLFLWARRLFLLKVAHP